MKAGSGSSQSSRRAGLGPRRFSFVDKLARWGSAGQCAGREGNLGPGFKIEVADRLQTRGAKHIPAFVYDKSLSSIGPQRVQGIVGQAQVEMGFDAGPRRVFESDQAVAGIVIQIRARDFHPKARRRMRAGHACGRVERLPTGRRVAIAASPCFRLRLRGAAGTAHRV